MPSQSFQSNAKITKWSKSNAKSCEKGQTYPNTRVGELSQFWVELILD